VFTRTVMAYTAAAQGAVGASAPPPTPDITALVAQLMRPLQAAQSTAGSMALPSHAVATRAAAVALGGLAGCSLVPTMTSAWRAWLQEPWGTKTASAPGGAALLDMQATHRFQAMPLILPAKSVYPIPNTAPVGPPSVFRDDAECSAALNDLQSFGVQHKASLGAGASVAATLIATAPPLTKQLAERLVGRQQRYRLTQPGVFTVHWWAQAWKRPQAQLKHGTGDAACHT
jgi:hypothetical protein